MQATLDRLWHQSRDSPYISLMEEFNEALEAMLAENPGAVSIAAGIALLRQLGATEPNAELQTFVGTFAAERWRPILFDLRP